MRTTNGQGSIVCVGVGMTLGAHIAPLARSYIEQADVVFCNVSNTYVEAWVMAMNADVRSLQHFYAEGKSRKRTYQQMIEAMMAEVRKGKNVVGAFYGHPGVFALAPHEVIVQARNEGFAARMVPGISAEDCLYADVGIDPGLTGCLHYETSQFMLYQRAVDTAAYLILWQVGVAGDTTTSQYETANAYRVLLAEQLEQYYPSEHQVILYEAAVLPTDTTRIEKVSVSQLGNVEVFQHTTLVVPPANRMVPNDAMRARLKMLG